MKFQVRWDLRSGALQAVAIEAGRDCDYKTPLQAGRVAAGLVADHRPGLLRHRGVPAAGPPGVFWLSRLQFGTAVFTPEAGRCRCSMAVRQPGPFVDQPILVGTERKVACRVVAWRVPEEVANRRRQKLIAEARRKDGRVPSEERLAWCDWTILITNVPAELLTPAEVAVLYRARWQIELLFKRWKSLGLIAALSGTTAARQMVRLWARLLAVLVQHWLLLTTPGATRTSLAKAARRSEAMRSCWRWSARPGATGGRDRAAAPVLSTTAKQNKRKRPSTFELLNDASRLEYSLT